MPGAVPHTSTHALNNATLPCVLALADEGYRDAMRRNPHLMAGLNVHEGLVTNKPVAEALGYAYRNPASAIDQAKGR
jgi:alanine dehydrogenase